MNKVPVFDNSGKKVKEIQAPEGIFSVSSKEHLVYEAVINYRANQRRGSASTKIRKEVRGGGRKPWRQKGTGRARAGSIRSPLWRSGGITFGPHPRDYSYRIPKKAKMTALKSVLTRKLDEEKIRIMEKLDIPEPKTKEAVKLLKQMELDDVLFVDSVENMNLMLSTRNIPGVRAVDSRYLNIYDVLSYSNLVFSQQAFDDLMERLK
jgi:large subunit ribosomal protein L4